jgi:hypothetical protein
LSDLVVWKFQQFRSSYRSICLQMKETYQQKTSLDALNEPQRDAVVSEDNRLLVLAGAGSGKTKTLLQKNYLSD